MQLRFVQPDYYGYGPAINMYIGAAASQSNHDLAEKCMLCMSGHARRVPEALQSGSRLSSPSHSFSRLRYMSVRRGQSS